MKLKGFFSLHGSQKFTIQLYILRQFLKNINNTICNRLFI